MEEKPRRTPFSLPTMFIATVLIMCLIRTTHAQAPILTPDQTINLSTGEMQFNLPLGVVKGRNGRDFPVSVAYKAGITINQPASPAGLGFSYGTGGISRKVVMVPDQNTGGPSSYEMIVNDPDCDEEWWVFWLEVANEHLKAIGHLITAISYVIPPLGYILGSMHYYVQTIQNIVTAALLTPYDYNAGGTHIQAYDPGVPPSDERHGRGFLYSECVTDLPDMYFVNTPFISGELVWYVDETADNGGYFIFKNNAGSAVGETRTVKVDYDLGNEQFTITLADGARLFFDETQKSNSYSKTLWQHAPSGASLCKSSTTQRQIQRVPDMWFLTKVLYPDYVDGEGDDLNPKTTADEDAQGSWLLFEYERREIANARPLPRVFQSSSMSSTFSTPGSDPVAQNTCDFEEVVLKRVLTPDQFAVYNYEADREDNLWFHIDKMDWYGPERNATPASARDKWDDGAGTIADSYIQGKRLKEIVIYKNMGTDKTYFPSIPNS